MRNRLFLALTAVCAVALLFPDGASAQEDIPTTVTVGEGRSVKVGSDQHPALKKGRIPPGWTTRSDHPNAQFLEVDGKSVGKLTSFSLRKENVKKCFQILNGSGIWLSCVTLQSI